MIKRDHTVKKFDKFGCYQLDSNMRATMVHPNRRPVEKRWWIVEKFWGAFINFWSVRFLDFWKLFERYHLHVHPYTAITAILLFSSLKLYSRHIRPSQTISFLIFYSVCSVLFTSTPLSFFTIFNNYLPLVSFFFLFWYSLFFLQLLSITAQ